MNAEHIPYFEKTYCDDCIDVHWVEVIRYGKIICHGQDYFPKNTPTQYIRRSGRGFEVVPISQPIPLPLDWQMAMQLANERESAIDVNQDW
jgi:hypothetical protein